jgi:LmbE family N-acetylglucosaminyl deacetylase
MRQGITSVLALGAHPDDLELGCGGTLAKLVASGVHVRALILTEGLQGKALDGHSYDRTIETRDALALLGVRDIVQAELPDTQLPGCRAAGPISSPPSLTELRPERVYTMFGDDRHQDHRAVYEASLIACRQTRQLLSYETPSSWPNFQPAVFDRIGEFLDLKIAAIQRHRSQLGRSYMDPGQIRANALFRGNQVGFGPCEAFVAYKFVN